MSDNIDDQGRVHGDHCPWRNPALGCACGVGFAERFHRIDAKHATLMRSTRWTGATATGSWERFGYVGSCGGASLQACALVLVFAACVESQRPTCHACGLWHDDATPCELHAPGIGELLERATAFAEELRAEWAQNWDAACADRDEKFRKLNLALLSAGEAPLTSGSATLSEPLEMVSASCRIMLDDKP